MEGGALLEVQIFGTQKSQDTKKAIRFFSERGVKIHFVDLEQRAIAKGELMRFVERFSIEELIDRDSRRFTELGLAAAPPSKDRWIERLLAEPLLLRQPLVRQQNRLTVGTNEAEWKLWCTPPPR